MVSFKEKTIGKKKYLYAEYSFRSPDKKIKKISKLIKEKGDSEKKEIKEYFLKKEIESYQNYAIKRYKSDPILTKDKILKIEAICVEYKHLLRKLTKNQMADVLDRFTINFTYETNALEGNSLTLKDVTMVLNENIIPKGADLRDIYETRNTREANEMLFKKGIKIDVKDILNIHSLLVRDTGVKTGFKKIPNFLIMRDVKTTPPEKVEEEINSLIAWYKSSKENEHPLKLASDFHAKFEKIHPFEDGNGRVGRLLINSILLEHGYPPLIIRKTMRASYFSALEAYDNDYKNKLYRFLIEKFERTFYEFFQIYIQYL
jgi:Fic family protein